jgi:hypothetical protein
MHNESVPLTEGAAARSCCEFLVSVTMHANKSIGSMTERQRIAVAALLTANACAGPWNHSARADLAADSDAAP